MPGEPWIAYVWDAQGVKVIRMVRPDGTGDHLAIGGPPVDTEHPAWSPDGTRIAYQADWHEILVADADGSDPVTVAYLRGCRASTSTCPPGRPDGTRIAFRRVDADGGYYTRSSIDVIDLATGQITTVFEPTPPEFLDWPRWSPDGTSMVVELERYERDPVSVDDPGAWASAIAVVDLLDDPAAAPRIVSRWDVHAAYPDWSPTDDRIVFGTYDLGEFNETDEASNLFTVRPDGSDLTQLTTFGGTDDRATQPFWTPDGQRIIFTWIKRTGYHDAQVGFMDADGGNLTHGLPGATPVYVTHPRLRPTP